ncbi:hypothetical protein FA13DRAFT_1785913 [Coprinellus micaceus]|uniref:Uncharacterized protein n=1 Tax=Coprinellus micaceus TaxID=71717 RepID=A0A4Y7TWY7_COPMI|nr:hypothetical protein FA13DRAFT_1785913 [Coprinellus micaceus]
MSLDTSTSPEQQLEKIFLQVEEESERRAEQERMRAARQALVDTDTLKRVKERRRGSISISRLGQYPVEEAISTPPGSVPPTPGSFSALASKSPFYQSQIAAASTSSVASGASAFSDDDAHCEDPDSVVQIQQIPPKQTIATKIMPRRLSRARSTQILPKGDSAATIDVSVHETTELSTTVSEEGEDYTTPSRRASVSARHSLRSQPSLSPVAEPTSPTWIEKFTQKFKRKGGRDSQSVPPTPITPS